MMSTVATKLGFCSGYQGKVSRLGLGLPCMATVHERHPTYIDTFESRNHFLSFLMVEESNVSFTHFGFIMSP